MELHSGSGTLGKNIGFGGSALPSSHFARVWVDTHMVGGVGGDRAYLYGLRLRLNTSQRKGVAFSQRSCLNSATAHLYCQGHLAQLRLYVLFTAQSLATRQQNWRSRAQPLEPDSWVGLLEQMGIFYILVSPS